MIGCPYELRPIGWVESPVVDPELAPKQGNEGSPEAWPALEISRTWDRLGHPLFLS